MGKGSRARALTVPKEEFDKSFENIFGKKPPKEQYVPPPLPQLSDSTKAKNK
jgi:hypothetical protein